MARLQPGMRFRMIEGDDTEYEVLRVSFGAATVRSTRTTAVEIRDAEGEVTAAFERSGRPFRISPNSSVEVIQ